MATGQKSLAPQLRRILVCAGLATALSGCTHLPDWLDWLKPAEQSEPQRAQVEIPTPLRKPHHARPRRHGAPPPEQPPPVEVAMVDPNALVGLRPPAVEKLLGTPAAIAKDEMSLVWSYAAEGCALRVYFYPDLKTSDFHVLKFSLAGADGKALDDDAACRRKLLAVREKDAG